MIYVLLIILLAFLLRFNVFRTPRRGVVVLLYHRISSEKVGTPLDKFTVSEARFRKQIEFIERLGYRFISPNEVETAGDKSVLITFDDGYRDNLIAARVLKEHGITGLFFISSAYVGGKFGGVEMLREEDIRSLVDMGMYIGSHSHHHLKLGELPLEVVTSEVLRSKEYLDCFFDVKDFAYPYGNRSEHVVGVLRRAGFLRGYIIGQEIYRNSVHSSFEIPRGIVRYNTTLLDLYLILTRGRSTF